MKISCLIAAYRAENYIAHALSSIREQRHQDWEVVVVEDGSHDRTQALVEQFAASVESPVRYENLGVNCGVAVARSRLLDLAKGEALAFLDADDWWTPAHLENASRAFEGGADLAVARIQLFDLDSGSAMETYAPPPELFVEPITSLFGSSGIMTSSSVALRMPLARSVGGFESSLRIGEDRDYWLRCAARGAKFADTGEVTCFYAKHATSTMAKTLVWAEQEVRFFEKHRDFPEVPERIRRSRLAHALTNYGRLVRSADRTKSRRALVQAFRLQPTPSRLAFLVRSFL